LEKLFIIIKEARAFLTSVPKSSASDKTLACYAKNAKRLRSLAKDPNDFGELLVLAQKTSKLNTWYSRRAPLVMMARGGLEHFLSEQDKIQCLLKMAEIPTNDGQWEKFRTAVVSVKHWHENLKQVMESKPPSQIVNRKSKRVSLKGLPDDWREKIIKRTPKYYPATLVAAVTGCRPDELVHGVKLFMENGMLVAFIKGSKTTEKTGQPWRKLSWPINSESVLVRELCSVVQAQKGELLVKIECGKKFHGAIRAASKREWAGRKEDVTPYCFRHHAAGDMKGSGTMTSVEISAALGHLSDVTKSRYGHANMGRSSGVSPCSVVAARPVSVKKKNEFDHKSLKENKAKSSGKRKVRIKKHT
jgi:hypothetical protein